MLASWLLLACALTLAAAGFLYTEAVTLSGLHRQLLDAPPADRAVTVRTSLQADRLARLDAAIDPELAAVMAPTGGSIVRVARSGPYAAAEDDPETVTELLLFASYESIEEHATLVAGSWPEPGGTPIEVGVSATAARALALEVGGGVELVDRLDSGHLVPIRIAGIWEPDAADPYWLGEPLILTGSQGGGRFTTRGPLIVSWSDLWDRGLARSVETEWRAIPDVGGFRAEHLDDVAALAAALPERVRVALPSSNQASVSTKLPAILAEIDRAVVVSQSGILLLLVQYGILAAYAVVLVAALLVERRRPEAALLRARGAGTTHLLGLAAGEALLVTVPAAVAAPWLATGIVAVLGLAPSASGSGLAVVIPGPTAYLVTAVGALAAVVVLTVPTLTAGVSLAGVRAAIGRQVGRTLPQRLGLDLGFLVLGAVGLWQLRQYGAPLTADARGTLGVDPLLVAAPGLGLLGGAVLAIRFVPRLAELAALALQRGRGLVVALGGRQVARRPLRYTRAALLLILAAALGTFASAHAATWARSQADQAAYATGADLRILPGGRLDLPDWAAGPGLRALDGVEAATPVSRYTLDVGRNVRGAPMLGVDGAMLAGLVVIRPGDDRDATLGALAGLAGGRDSIPAIDVPAGTRRLGIRISSQIRADPESGTPVTAGEPGPVARVALLDRDGRLWRLSANGRGPISGEALLVVPLVDPGSDLAIPGPVRIVGLEVEVPPYADDGVLRQGVEGFVDLVDLAASDSDAGEPWGDLAAGLGTPWRWQVNEGGGAVHYQPPADHPARLTVRSYSATIFRLDAPAAGRPDLPTVASDAFLAATLHDVGDRITVDSAGVRLGLELVGRARTFPTVGPGVPFVIVDGQGPAMARFWATGQVGPPAEWWLRLAPGRGEAVAATVASPPFGADQVVSRATLQADLLGDPLALGVIGVLGLGSVASLVFAFVGFLVVATVSVAERLGEFALLKAVGLSPRQLLAWLAVEGFALLAVGLTIGTGLGVVLAWVTLPVATLTTSGLPPVPEPVVVVPPGAALPTVLLALVLSLSMGVLVRRQLPGARTSAVLRARDE